MMEKKMFTLYSVLKNEDAIPFASDRLLVVADGLGGSGSSVHNIDRNQFPSILDALNASAFSDFSMDQVDDLQQYSASLLSSMIDDIADTSALWGSRIVMARLINALLLDKEFVDCDLSDQTIRNKLAEYILSGLNRTKSYFSLENGKYGNQLILPTTLAVIKYHEVLEDVEVEAIWAGDSRCYVLLPEGLKQLSSDDEDESGAITNLFYADNRNIYLNYRKYTFKKPCILFTASDGTFDPYEPYDNFGLESTIFKSIFASNSFEEWKNSLFLTYNQIHSDDATMSVAVLGLENFAELKNAFRIRNDYLSSLLTKYKASKELLNILDQPKEYYDSYVFNRTKDKYISIINKITENQMTNPTDPIIEKIDAMLTLIKNDISKMENRHHQDIISQFQLKLLQETENIAKFFNSNVNSAEVRKIINDFNTLKELRDKINKLQVMTEKYLSERSDLNNAISQLKKELDEQLKESIDANLINQRIKYQNNVEFILNYFRKSLANYQRIAYRINLKSNYYCLNSKIVDLKKGINRFIRNTNDMKNTNNKLKKYQDSFQVMTKEYQSAIKSLIDNFSNDWKFFQAEVCPEIVLSISDFKNTKEINYMEERTTILLENKETISQGIVDYLAANYQQKTIIDNFYHPSRLADFRLYNSLKKDNADITNLMNELECLEKNYLLD